MDDEPAARESARWQITMSALLLFAGQCLLLGGLARRWIPRTGTASPSVPGRSSAGVTSPVMSKAAPSSGTSSSTSVLPETPPPAAAVPTSRRIIWSPHRAQPGAAHSHLRGCGRGPPAVPEPLTLDRTNGPPGRRDGQDKVAYTRGRSHRERTWRTAPARPSPLARWPAGSGIPLADACGATGQRVRPQASAEPGEDGLPGRPGSGSCAGADVQVDGGVLGDDGLAGRALVDDLVLVGLARRGRGDGAQSEPVGLQGSGRLGQ